jgi:predicted enzyme related to lactoylglutathione lyase
MKVNTLFVNLTSEDPQRLRKFYADVVGLPMKPEMGEGALDAGGATLGFDSHSDTKGSTKEPSRVLIDLFVDDVVSEQKRLEAHGVKFIRNAEKEYWGGVISTFVDPDGNYCQIIEYKPETPAGAL